MSKGAAMTSPPPPSPQRSWSYGHDTPGERARNVMIVAIWGRGESGQSAALGHSGVNTGTYEGPPGVPRPRR